MEHGFDRLAKSVGAAMTRREALWRFGLGVGLAALAAVGLKAANDKDCRDCCEIICKNLDVPPRKGGIGQCMKECRETGVAVGPSGEVSFQCVPFCVES